MQDELPREPMPRSYRPVWVYLGLMVGLTCLIALAAAVVALAVRQA
jgi:hypothetical protein